MALSRVQRGEPITASLFNKMIDEINRNALISISGGKLTRSINGTTLAVSAQDPQVPAERLPFEYTQVPNTATESGIRYRIRAGTINNYLPDNIFDRFVLTATTPNSTDLNYVVLDCFTNGNTVVSASISSSVTAPPVPATFLGSAPVTFSALLHVVRGTTAYRTIGKSSITARVTEATRTATVSFGIGQFPYNIYYTWSLFS